jgi:hypothetical protein
MTASSTSDLVSRVLAAITELENAAREAKWNGDWLSVRNNDMPLVCANVALVNSEGEFLEYVATDVERSTAVHIALNDPPTALRRCAADRRILELHRQVPADVPGNERDESTGCQICGKALLCDWIEGNGVCDTVVALADAYGVTAGVEVVEP